MRSRLKTGVLVATGLFGVCGLILYGLDRARSGASVTGAPRLVSALKGLSKRVQDQRQFASLNDVGIHFYALVQDQYGEPVSQAKINCVVDYSTGFSQGQRRSTAISDTRGYFEIHPGNGASFSAAPEKSGYELASSNFGGNVSYLYGTNRYVADKDRPVVIKMWKLQGAEPLMRVTRDLKLPGSQQAWSIDLTSGNIVKSGGDIKLSLTRPAGEESFESPQPWSIQVEAVDGGVILSTPEVARFTFQAPEQGYQKKLILTSPNATTIWQPSLSFDFFVKCHSGLIYAKGGLWIRINKSEGDTVSLSYSFLSNVHGSRNWEEKREMITER